MTDFILSSKAKNLQGLRYGSLIATRPIGKDGKNVIWEFQCDCGETYISVGAWVVAQQKKATNPLAPSCGCLNQITTRELRFKHGLSKHPLFWVWVAMVERCTNPKNSNYGRYGARGIYVCDEWVKDSTAFIQWALSHGWQPGLHLDKDVLCHQKGLPTHYGPDTCQFLSASENSRATKKWLTKHQ